MKTFFAIIAGLKIVCCLHASESTLTTTYQPLAGLGSGEVAIVQVTCLHWYVSSATSPVDLIHVRNVPPTDNSKEATEDLNLASLCGLKFSTNDLGDLASVPMIQFDATKFDVSKSGGYSKDAVVRASFECLRRCLPERLKTTKITLRSKDSDREWISKIVNEFDAASRDQPFYTPQ